MEHAALLQFCKISHTGQPYDIIDSRVAEYIILNNDFMVLHGQPLYYKDGVFGPDNQGLYIQDLIKTLILEDLRTDSRITRVYKLILKDYRLQVDTEQLNNYPRHWINFKNGMLDVLSGKMHEHSPEYKSVNQIPHNYIPGLNIEESTFYKFVQSRVPDKENQKMLFEYMGYTLLPNIIFQKFLILVGVGNSGKSTILSHMEQVLGKNNLAAIPLQGLSERFTTAYLLNKQANICGDLSNAALKDTSVLKQLTGEDLCQAEYKGGQIFFFRNRAKFLFSCNEMPTILDDRSNGFYRRLLIIRFDHEGEFIPGLTEKLQDEHEIEILISHIVEGAKLALKRGKIYESGANLGEILRVQEESDSVAAFLNNEAILDKNCRVKRSELFRAYEDFCRTEERQPLGKTAFFKAFRTKGFRETKIQGEIFIVGIKDFFRTSQRTPFDD